MLPFQIEKIYLDEKAEKDSVTQTILKAMPDIPVERVQDKRALIKTVFLLCPILLGSGKNIFSLPIFMEDV